MMENSQMLAKVDPDFTMPAGFDENDKKTRDKCLYLKQLLADKRSMAQMPGVFNHLERLLDDGKSRLSFWFNLMGNIGSTF
jgi:hypothetical protein